MGNRVIFAEQTTQLVKRWFESTITCRVLHKFEHVCNLVNQDNEVIAIHNERVPIGPFSLTLTQKEGSVLDFSQPIQLSQTDQLLLIGTSSLSLQQAAFWNARPKWHQFDTRTPLPNNHKPSDNICDLTQRLITGLQVSESNRVKELAKALSGLGAGLTPAGDDVLIGIMFALFVLDREPEWHQLICNATSGRTSTLSAAFLKSAANGRAIKPWHNLIDGKPGAIEQLVSFGGSSGQDALFGFTQALNQLSRS